jgi:cyclic pyranopterin phosphate synthase
MYCMPAEGLAWLPKPTLLTDDEVIRLVRIAVERLGITEVRFTGGEPLLRPGLLAIIAACATLDPRPQLSVTTNGIGLDRLAAPLAAAGLDRINVSLDTIDPERFAALTRRQRLPEVLAGLRAATAAGLTPVKLNTVLMRGVNDDEAPALLRFALEHAYELRFIEQMPLDAGHIWDRSQMVTAQEILASLRSAYTLEPDVVERGGAPAETWLVTGPAESGGAPAAGGPGAGADRSADGGPGAGGGRFTPGGPGPGGLPAGGRPPRVGVIGSVTRPFCGACDRTRLTADGAVRNCLFARGETDLRGALRGGADDDALAALWREAMWGKLPGHGIDDPSFLQPDRPMSAIGG